MFFEVVFHHYFLWICHQHSTKILLRFQSIFSNFAIPLIFFSCVSIYVKPESINHTTFYWPRLRCWKMLGSGSDRVFKSRAGFLWRDAFCGVLSRMHLNFGAILHANNTVWIEFIIVFGYSNGLMNRHST